MNFVTGLESKSVYCWYGDKVNLVSVQKSGVRNPYVFIRQSNVAWKIKESNLNNKLADKQRDFTLPDHAILKSTNELHVGLLKNLIHRIWRSNTKNKH